MATYAIGDIQGCLTTLHSLLRRIDFTPGKDQLWLAGDLVCRGPDALGVLRWARDLGPHLVAVLGNHDLRLLAIAEGLKRDRQNDQLESVLRAPDRLPLLTWLRQLPLLHLQAATPSLPAHVLLHAGLVPQWDVATAAALAKEVGTVLRGRDHRSLLGSLSAPVAPIWQTSLHGLGRLQFITKVLTYLRLCSPEGRPHFDFTGAPSAAPAGLVPWFAAPGRASADTHISCGHWSALGLHLAANLAALDSGCVWGQALTARRLEDGCVFSEPTASADMPSHPR